MTATDKQKPEPGRPTNEITVLADFIRDHQVTSLDRYLAAIMDEIGTGHDVWASQCSECHLYEDAPCDDYERGLSLGIAWLKARIEAKP